MKLKQKTFWGYIDNDFTIPKENIISTETGNSNDEEWITIWFIEE